MQFFLKYKEVHHQEKLIYFKYPSAEGTWSLEDILTYLLNKWAGSVFADLDPRLHCATKEKEEPTKHRHHLTALLDALERWLRGHSHLLLSQWPELSSRDPQGWRRGLLTPTRCPLAFTCMCLRTLHTNKRSLIRKNGRGARGTCGGWVCVYAGVSLQKHL